MNVLQILSDLPRPSMELSGADFRSISVSQVVSDPISTILRIVLVIQVCGSDDARAVADPIERVCSVEMNGQKSNSTSLSYR